MNRVFLDYYMGKNDKFEKVDEMQISCEYANYLLTDIISLVYVKYKWYFDLICNSIRKGASK